ncbi:MAG: hypothetical protein EH225_05130, partial [Calditrichaeota bacterium]
MKSAGRPPPVGGQASPVGGQAALPAGDEVLRIKVKYAGFWLSGADVQGLMARGYKIKLKCHFGSWLLTPE